MSQDSHVSLSSDFSFYFFFFQAEDGIRDSSVTGVQTCALPISNGVRTTQRNRVATADRDARAWGSDSRTRFAAARDRRGWLRRGIRRRHAIDWDRKGGV